MAMSLSTRLRTLPLLRLKDNLLYSRTLRHLNACRLAVQARLSGGGAKARAALLGCRAVSFSESEGLNRWLSAGIQPLIDHPAEPGFWEGVVRAAHPRYDAPLRREPGLTRSVLLKAPGPDGEKGMLLMLFEYNWARLILGLDDDEFAWLDEHYDLVLSTSWSPTDYAVLAAVLSKTRSPVFVQACNHLEMPRLAGFHPRVRLLESLGCDWINPDLYPDEVKDRPIDFLMIANWGQFKRHWDFFAALSRMPANLRVVLVGQAEGGRDAEFIRRQAVAFGVPQSLEVHQSLPIAEVARLQSQSKVALIFSRREGCCVAFVEAMFAGCAVGLRADAHVGPLAYVNEETGLVLRPGHLAEDLMQLHQTAGGKNPGAWARANISCHTSHAKLNELAKQSHRERGLPWVRDLAVPHWRPYPAHAVQAEAEALLPAYAELHRKFPRVFGKEFFEQAVLKL